MARIETITLECDMPHTEHEPHEDVLTFAITAGRLARTVDLCATHARPVLAAMDAGRRLDPLSRARGR